jgi:hypothetical protein
MANNNYFSIDRPFCAREIVQKAQKTTILLAYKSAPIF